MSGKRKVPVVIRRHSILAAFGDTHAAARSDSTRIARPP